MRVGAKQPIVSSKKNVNNVRRPYARTFSRSTKHYYISDGHRKWKTKKLAVAAKLVVRLFFLQGHLATEFANFPWFFF